MNVDMELIRRMARDLNIGKAPEEVQETWMCRVIYSALGHTALASLWDQEEDGEPISITHFKRRIEKNYRAYKALYPQISAIFSAEEDELTEEIYSIYSAMGFFYHSPNRLTPAAKSHANVEDITLQRGISPGIIPFMSGLGFYQINSNGNDVNTIRQMFGLPRQTLQESYDYLIATASWTEDRLSYRKEYLRMQPPFTRGYWKENPDANGEVSLLRVGDPSGYMYYLYRYKGRTCEISHLPGWLTEGYEYRKVSNWILAAKGVLPSIEYTENGEIVSIKINYLLPPREQFLLKLYSWPQSFRRMPSDFNRVADKRVFCGIAETLREIGYTISEV